MEPESTLITEQELHEESTASGTSLLVWLDEEDAARSEPDVPETPLPWERQLGESFWAFHAFCHFRDLPVHSASIAYRHHRRECERSPVPDSTPASKHWQRWSSEHDWVARAAAWDTEVDRQAREKLVQTQIEARERHARLGQALTTVMTLPVKAALEAAREPEFLKTLIDSAKSGASGTYALLAAVARMAHEIPSVVTMERLALGLTTESVEIEDKREFDVEFANRILASEEATELFIQALHSVAHGAGTHPALGSGALSEPRQMGDGSAPEHPDEEAGGSGAATDHPAAGGDAAAPREIESLLPILSRLVSGEEPGP